MNAAKDFPLYQFHKTGLPQGPLPLAMIESPYRGDLQRNRTYLLRLIRYVTLELGYSPYASHLMLTTALDDNLAAERRLGIMAGYAWAFRADLAFFGTDYGYSSGMAQARDYYESIKLECIDIKIGENDALENPEAETDDGRRSARPGVR